MSSTPQLWIDACTKAHQRLLNVARDLTDAQARRPSLLPNWTVGHLLTHLGKAGEAKRVVRRAIERLEKRVADHPGRCPGLMFFSRLRRCWATAPFSRGYALTPLRGFAF